MTSENNKRIVKNSLLLYGRMIIVMALGLYTSRIVLRALGVEDYGIYNLVGGVVVFFTIVNAAMLSATQRYINFGLGVGDNEKLKVIFKTACIIHLILAAVILFFSETVGLWLLNYKLLIPYEKLSVAHLVFQMSVLTVIVQVVTLPYNAVVVAHEKLSMFAVISIVQACLALLVAMILLTVNSGKLCLYAVLTCIIQVIIASFYFLYCRFTFYESRGRASFDKNLFKEMSIFAGWCMIGVSAGMMYTQGLNILLGMFFLPFVNAARGLSVSVQSAVNQIFNNVQTALIPQLIQSYARREYEYFQQLIINGSKYLAYLLLIVAIPVFLRTPYIVNLWLGEIPQYVVIFIRILLGVSLIEAISGPLMRASDATGDIKKYHVVVGGVLILIVPIAYIFLKLGYQPPSVFYVYLIISVCALGARLIILRQKIGLSIRLFLLKVILPVVSVGIVAMSLSYFCSLAIENSFIGLVLFVSISVLQSSISIFIFGLNKEERMFIKNKITRFLRKIK